MAHLVYILSGTCGEAWSEFSWKAFHNLRVVLGYFLHQLSCFEFSSRQSAWIPNLVKTITEVVSNSRSNFNILGLNLNFQHRFTYNLYLLDYFWIYFLSVMDGVSHYQNVRKKNCSTNFFYLNPKCSAQFLMTTTMYFVVPRKLEPTVLQKTV